MKGVDQFRPPSARGTLQISSPVALSKNRHEGLGRVVVDDVQAIVVEDGRSGHTESQHGLERANVFGPDDLATHRESADESDAAEIHIYALAVGDRRFRREAVLEVFFDRGRRAVQLTLPDNFSRIEVDGVDHPSMLCQGSTRAVVVARVVKPSDGRFLFARADGRSDEDVVVPHDRRAPAQTGYVDLPGDVLGSAPGVGQRRIVGNGAGIRAAKASPTSLVLGR